MLLTEENYTCELSKETQEIAKKELNETNKLRKKAIADVRKWIKSQSHFRRARLDASFILRFLRMQKFDTKESCEILDKYLTMRVQHPTWFQNLDCRVRVLQNERINLIKKFDVNISRIKRSQTLWTRDTSLFYLSETSTGGGSSSPRPPPSTPASTLSATS